MGENSNGEKHRENRERSWHLETEAKGYLWKVREEAALFLEALRSSVGREGLMQGMQTRPMSAGDSEYSSYTAGGRRHRELEGGNTTQQSPDEHASSLREAAQRLLEAMKRHKDMLLRGTTIKPASGPRRDHASAAVESPSSEPSRRPAEAQPVEAQGSERAPPQEGTQAPAKEHEFHRRHVSLLHDVVAGWDVGKPLGQRLRDEAITVLEDVKTAAAERAALAKTHSGADQSENGVRAHDPPPTDFDDLVDELIADLRKVSS